MSKLCTAAADRAARAIPPAWPLAANVAVNPFLGQSGEDFAAAAARLSRVAGASITLPRAWFRERMDDGAICDADLVAAWRRAPDALRPPSLEALKTQVLAEPERPPAPPTVADLAAGVSGIDWPGLLAERISAWAAGYFDEGQAPWTPSRNRGAYQAWRAYAAHDLTPEITGLPGFALHAFETPDSAADLTERAVARLDLPPEALEPYFHQLLLGLGGWAQLGRYRLWQAELTGADDRTVTDLLAIRLVWEEALFAHYGPKIVADWREAGLQRARPLAADARAVVDAILQEAADRGAQRALSHILASPGEEAAPARPALQAAFCIDVRSEVLRRSLEPVDARIETIGFAGFFGLSTAHRRFASDAVEWRLPALLTPSLHSCASGRDGAEQPARVAARAKRAWGRFKLAAVSSFAFVEAAGPVYAGKLLADALGLPAPEAKREPPPRLDPALGLDQRIEMAQAVLRAMSITGRFARLVLLAGHGAAVVNNPTASALHCGACGGYPGDVNARLLADLLNDAEVRAGLAAAGLEIPADTLFVAALHDTTSDRVALFDEDHPSPDHQPDLAQARAWLEAAGVAARGERALRLPGAAAPALSRRGLDWSQIRPEWGLAGCRAFIAAPRARTARRSLQGQAFLHDYVWRKDRDFKVLELILTAPVVVASWISLQYFGSTTAPQLFGGGDKLLHNVTGGVGVVEGNGGLLRTGLPWQSVHDGERYIHEPLRLSVCIEAPREAISSVLEHHPGVRALFDNGWLHLFALGDAGRMAWRYVGNLGWTAEPAVADN